MEIRTSCGTLFVRPIVDKKKLKTVSPCEFLAMLLTENRGLPWAAFNRNNIVEIIDGTVSKDWKHIEKVLQYPLPALPTPNVVQLPRDAEILVYQHAERSYKLPQANDFIFSAEGLDFNHFLRIWIYLNKRIMEVVYVKEVQAALRSLALQGFPDAPKLAKRFPKQFDLSNERKMMKQHWSKVWLDLKVVRPKESLGVVALKQTQTLSSGPATASSRFPGQLGSVTSTSHRNRIHKTDSVSKLQLELLRSENRFLSVTVLVPKPKLQAAIVKAELHAVLDVQRCADSGFVGAIWYWCELVVEFLTCAQRDWAFRTISRASSTVVKGNVHPIGSGGAGEPKLYMSWVLPFYREDTPATLSSALDNHFVGTGYSSFFTFGQFDRPEGHIRIIFHNAPPALKTILKSHCFEERWFWTETVTDSDYPLQKEQRRNGSSSYLPSVVQKEVKANADIGVAEEVANDTGKESLGLAVKISDEEPACPLQTEQALKGSESTVPPATQGTTKVNADLDAAEQPASDDDNRAEASPAEDSGIETEVNANVDAEEDQARDTDKRAEASPAKDSVIETLTTSHFEDGTSGDNNDISEGQTQSPEKKQSPEKEQSPEEEAENDCPADSEATTTVLVDDTFYKIPTASALSLHEATFDTFTRMYLEFRHEKSEKTNCKTLIKLYRTFLETQFPYVDCGRKIDAFQRIEFHEPIIDPQYGGLSYPFTMAARNAYHKEIFELSEAFRMRTSTTSESHSDKITQQTMPCDHDIEQDQSAPEKASTTVINDGSTHKIPTALVLPLDKVTFNTFARMFMQMEPQEPEKLNSKNLLKLYRIFLNTQFPDIEGEPIIEAFQRLNHEEAVINTRPGGLSYPFFIESSYVYHKGLLVMAEKPQATAATIPSAKPTTSDETLAQQPRTPSPDRGESYNTADQAAGSERKRAASRTSSSTSSSSAFFELTPSGNTQQKPQEPDALSALERYLDDIDATLQLEREIIRTFHSKPDFQENAEGKDAG